MGPDKHPATPPEGAAREWLERERRRSDPAAHGFGAARPPKAERGLGPDWRGWSYALLVGAAGASAFTSPQIGWGLAVPLGVAGFFVYQYAVRDRLTAYRQGRRPDQTDALGGGGSGD